MKTLIFKILLLSTLAPLSAQAFYMALDCSASVPNGMMKRFNRVDTRHIELEVSDLQSSKSGYKESRAYGGGYPVSDSGIGTVTVVKATNQSIQMTLSRKAEIDPRTGVPTFWNYEGREIMKAVYDLRNHTLTLDTSGLAWFYQNPRVLTCQSN